MTILPKKKPSKSEEERESESNIDRYAYLQMIQSSSSSSSPQVSLSQRSPWQSQLSTLSNSDNLSNMSNLNHNLSHNLGTLNSQLNHRFETERPHKRRHRDRHREGSQDHSSHGSNVNIVHVNKGKQSPNHSMQSGLVINYEDYAIPSCSSKKSIVITRQHQQLQQCKSKQQPQQRLAEEDEESEEQEGFNSGDEYEKPDEHWTSNDWDQKEKAFERMLKKKGFIIRKMGEDGACFFRAVADQVYGDQEMHSSVRKLCLDYMEKNSDFFSQFVTENFASYIKRKREEQAHGNNPEMQAVSEIFNRPIEVYHYSLEPINVFKGCLQSDNEPIRLSYHKKIHYDSIVDPLKATIGVGLGLPGFQPGLAEKNMMDHAKMLSENNQLEQAMLEDKLRATDWEATDEAIEAQVARESYIEWLKEAEKRAKEKESGEGTSSLLSKTSGRRSSKPSSPNYPPKMSTPPPGSSKDSVGQKSPRMDDSTGNCSPRAGADSPGKFPAASGLGKKRKSPSPERVFDDWFGDDSDIARILAQSQKEYFDGLRSAATSAKDATNSGDSLMESHDSSGQSLPSTSSRSQ